MANGCHSDFVRKISALLGDSLDLSNINLTGIAQSMQTLNLNNMNGIPTNIPSSLSIGKVLIWGLEKKSWCLLNSFNL
jgi:hypothetical protein